MMTTNKENQRNRNLGLYIHLPFCQRKCSYCSFLSLVDQPGTVVQCYLKNLLAEADLRITDLCNGQDPQDDKRIQSFDIDTIFIGGGTPSLIDGNDMKTLLDGIRQRLTVLEQVEITMESNPNSLAPENLSSYREAGVNRLSIGVQSFDDGILSQIGRLHDAKRAMDAVSMARDAGFENISLDLMFGLPGQTLEQWRATLETAISLSPKHLSLYSLQIEEGTPLYRDYKAGKVPVIDSGIDRTCYHLAIDLLKKYGYAQYEISNFALDGFECRHNIKYWSMQNFLGLGLNASSYVNGNRWTNLSNLNQWTKEIGQNQLPVDPTKMLQDSFREAMGIFLFTGLRKTTGISFLEFSGRFGIDFFQAYGNIVNQLDQYRMKGWLDWTDPTAGSLWITENGFDHSNEIMAEFV